MTTHAPVSWLRIVMCWCGWHKLVPVGDRHLRCRYCRDVFVEEWVDL